MHYTRMHYSCDDSQAGGYELEAYAAHQHVPHKLMTVEEVPG